MRAVRAALLGTALLSGLVASCGKGREPSGGVVSRPSSVPAAAAPGEAAVPAAADGAPASDAGLTLVPANPDVQTGVRAVVQGLSPSRKAEILRVQWFVNGNGIGGEGDRMPGRVLRKGDVVTASAVVRTAEEEMVLTAPGVTVRNALPEISAATLSPLAPGAQDSVRIVATSRDPDDDPVSYRVRWFIDNTEIAGETTSELSLKQVGAKKGSWVHAEVHVFDDSAQGSRLLTPRILIVNTPPAVSRVVVSPGSGDRFAATVQVADSDGDPVTVKPRSLPKGVTLEGNILSWGGDAVPAGEELPVVLFITDGDGGDVEYSFRLSASRNR